MVYQCVSADVACFSRTDPGGASHYEDIYSVIPGIREAKQYFLFDFVDLGPQEAFVDYPVLREAVRAIVAAGLVPRLLTSGRHFTGPAQTEARFVELASLGVRKVILRLDEAAALALPDACLVNFINGCAACGNTSELRFDLDGEVPEVFFRVARRMEEVRFYTNIHPRVRLKTNSSRFDPDRPIEGLGSRAFRVVITVRGQVLLRVHERETTEIEVGSLREAPLVSLIEPGRLSAGRGRGCDA